MKQKSHFTFKVMKHITIVQGIGKILLFNLVLPPFEGHFLIKCETASFFQPNVAVTVSGLAEIVRTMGKRLKVRTNHFTFQFTNSRLEKSFMTFYTQSFMTYLRWLSFIAGGVLTLFCIWSAIAADVAPAKQIPQWFNAGFLLLPGIFSLFQRFRNNTRFVWYFTVVCEIGRAHV